MQKKSTKLATSFAVAFLCAACVPTHTASLSVPVLVADRTDRERAIIAVDLTELATRIDDFDPGRLAFYGVGRSPLPYRLVRSPGDGNGPQTALVEMPVRGDGTTRILVVCPGPDAPGEPTADGATRGITLEWRRAQR